MTVFALLLLATTPQQGTMPIPARLRVDECADRSKAGCEVVKQSPYRLPLDLDEPTDGKRAAVAQDGADCETIGQKVCASRTRPVLSADINPY